MMPMDGLLAAMCTQRAHAPTMAKKLRTSICAVSEGCVVALKAAMAHTAKKSATCGQ